MTQLERTPSDYWIATKEGVPVKKFATPGESYIPPEITQSESIETDSVDSLEALQDVETDKSVLTSEELELLDIETE